MKKSFRISVLFLSLGIFCSAPSMQASWYPTQKGLLSTLTKATISMLVLCSPSRTKAAGPSFLNTWGGSSYDYVMGVKATQDDTIAFTGYSQSYGDSRQGIIGEYTAEGTLDWVRKFGNSNNEYVEGIEVNDNGDFFVVGRTRSDGDGNYDVFVTKYNSTHDYQWFKTLGANSVDGGYAITLTSDGGFAVAGETRSYGASNYDMLLAKFDGDGVQQFIRTLQASRRDTARGITETADGGLALIGYSYISGSLRYDIVVAKFNATGGLEWKKSFGEGNNDFGSDIAATADGGMGFIGYTYRFGARRYYDIIYGKINSTGGLEYTKLIGGNHNDLGYAITSTSDQGFALTGIAYDDTNGFQGIVCKMDSLGDVVFSKLVGGSGVDYSVSIDEASNGDLIVGGYQNSFTGNSYYDGFVARLRGDGGADCGIDLQYNVTDITLNMTYGDATFLTVLSPTDTENDEVVAEDAITPDETSQCSITANPTSNPTTSPTSPTSNPTTAPSPAPSAAPSLSPSLAPSAAPTNPTNNPTTSPSPAPTKAPTAAPSHTPSPTNAPSRAPSFAPSFAPSTAPTALPTETSSNPTHDPTNRPTQEPTTSPTPATQGPSLTPSVTPSVAPTHPTDNPTASPTHPTQGPSLTPSTTPSTSPSPAPTALPTETSSNPTHAPSLAPSVAPIHPTDNPTTSPTLATQGPSLTPSTTPSVAPTVATSEPTQIPTTKPSRTPTISPVVPTENPSLSPTEAPTLFFFFDISTSTTAWVSFNTSNETDAGGLTSDDDECVGNLKPSNWPCTAGEIAILVGATTGGVLGLVAAAYLIKACMASSTPTAPTIQYAAPTGGEIEGILDDSTLQVDDSAFEMKEIKTRFTKATQTFYE